MSSAGCSVGNSSRVLGDMERDTVPISRELCPGGSSVSSEGSEGVGARSKQQVKQAQRVMGTCMVAELAPPCPMDMGTWLLSLKNNCQGTAACVCMADPPLLARQ